MYPIRTQFHLPNNSGQSQYLQVVLLLVSVSQIHIEILHFEK